MNILYLSKVNWFSVFYKYDYCNIGWYPIYNYREDAGGPVTLPTNCKSTYLASKAGVLVDCIY